MKREIVAFLSKVYCCKRTSNFEWQFRGCLLQHNLSYCVGISLQYEQERHEGWSACGCSDPGHLDMIRFTLLVIF
jgi:hypothetical protein